jgi:hypothetical protein
MDSPPGNKMMSGCQGWADERKFQAKEKARMRGNAVQLAQKCRVAGYAAHAVK